VDYVELDPLVVRTGQKFVDAADRKAIQDGRVKTHYLDGRLFINTTSEKFDVVILDLPDPYNGLLNRFYTREFFAEVKRVLKKGGLFSLGVSSSEEYIGPETRGFNSSIYWTVRMVFPRVAVVPGERAFFVAGTSSATLPQAGILIDRLIARKIKTIYVQPFYLRYKLAPQRVDYFENQLARGKSARLNFDLLPVSYYYDTVLWSAQFSPGFSAVFNFFDRPVFRYPDPTWLYRFGLPALAFLAFGSYFWRRRQGENVPTATILTAVFTTGWAGMALEVLLIASFQSLYGYVYARVSLIVTAFMAGLAIGSWSISRSSFSFRRTYEALAAIMLTLSVFAVELPAFLSSLSRSQSGLSSQLFVFLLTALVGLMVGAVFPLAAKIFYREKDEAGRVGGMIYGADLFGAALGAIVVSAFIFPIAGLTFSCWIIGFLCLVSLVFLIVCLLFFPSFLKER
jgi:spermidine synthase